jgi:hypothetical protein
MDCNTARLLIALKDPAGREQGSEDAGLLATHLTACSDCASLAGHEKRFDDWISPAMVAIPTPIDLKSRILTRLQTQEPRRRWVRPLVLSMSAAAAAILVILIGYSLFPRKPGPNIHDIAHYQTPTSANEVEERFKEVYGIHTTAPRQFDYNLLGEWKTEPHQKKNVPVLVFKKNMRGREESARVLIFSDRDFDLSKLPDEESIYERDYKVQSLPSADGHVAYVVLYTSGAELEDFFPEGGVGAALE